MTNFELSSDDEIFEQYKKKRMQELCSTVQDIVSECELIEKTKTLTMIVHFYKLTFNRCKAMDNKLREISKEFPDILFYRVDAEICPTVVNKLGVKVLPFLGFFKEGYFVDQLVGFDNIGNESIDMGKFRSRIKNSNVYKDIQ